MPNGQEIGIDKEIIKVSRLSLYQNDVFSIRASPSYECKGQQQQSTQTHCPQRLKVTYVIVQGWHACWWPYYTLGNMEAIPIN